jgi:acetyl esterase/lipase
MNMIDGLAPREFRQRALIAGLALASVFSAPVDASEAISMSGLFNRIVADRGVTVDGNITYGPLPRHRLDVYRPTAVAERRAVILFTYGGGWTSGERSTYEFVGAAFAAQGYRTVIADYRLYPEVSFPTFLDDAVSAYRWTSEKFRDACGAPRPVIVAGHSAGAYISAMLALDRAKPQPAALVGLAGPYSFDPTTWPSTRAIFARAAASPDTARPVAYAKADAPPALLLHGASDTTVKPYNTVDLAAALRARGNRVEQIDYPGIGHVGLVTAIARPLRWRAPVLTDTLTFLERQGLSGLLDAPCKPSARRSP